MISFIVSNCSFKPVVKHHGVPSLEKKQKSLIIRKTNKNDIIKILGNPSTTSKFDNDVWIYIERKKTNQSIFKLGKQKIEKSNVVVLELDSRGMLSKKEIFDLNDMNKYKFTENTTQVIYQKNTYMYNVLRSLREKINSPTRKKNK